MSESGPVRPQASFSIGFLSGLGGQVFYLALAFPASVMLARLLGPEGKGAVDLAVLIPTLIVLFTNLGLPTASSYLIGSRRFPVPDVVSNLVAAWLLLAFILTPLYCGLAALG